VAIKTIASGTVADAYLAILADRGIDYLFANAEPIFAPLIEAYAKAQRTARRCRSPSPCRMRMSPSTWRRVTS
jgi:acetolactate synthase-1/2/3 large subunit